MKERVACLGAGRSMGRGIAVVFAYAGHDVVVLVDFKARDDAAFEKLAGRMRAAKFVVCSRRSRASACSTQPRSIR